MNLFAVWTPGSILSALVGGALLGYLVIARFDNPRFTPRESVGAILVMGWGVGAVFYASQIIETYLGDGPALAWRVISRFALFLR